MDEDVTEKPQVPLEEALPVAEAVLERLSKHVARCTIAGSIRRRRPMVSDIEIVAEPKLLPPGLFDNRDPDIEPIMYFLSRIGRVLRAGPRYMCCADVLGSGIQCDVFLVHPPAQWGSILAIRTGSATFAHKCMSLLISRGFRHVDGRVIDADTYGVQDTPTEEAFFALCGIPCPRPQDRDA